MMASSSSSSSSSIVDARTVEALNSATATAHAASASSTQRRNAATVSKGPLAFNRVAAEHTSRMMQYTYARAHASASKFAIALTRAEDARVVRLAQAERRRSSQRSFNRPQVPTSVLAECHYRRS